MRRFHAREMRARVMKSAAFAGAAIVVFAVAPAGVTSAEYRSTASELASVVASAWHSGVCPRSTADSIGLVNQVKDEKVGEAAVMTRLHDLADSLLREAGYEDFDAVWERVATLSLPDTAAERDRLLGLVRCFYPGDIGLPALNGIIDALVAALGSSAEAADAAVSLLIDPRVINAFAVVTTSDHADSVPVASPVDDPELEELDEPNVLSTLDDAVLSKTPRCSFSSHDPGDKFRAGNQRLTTYNNLGQRIFGVYNEISFLYNPARYCTKFGDSSRYGETYWCLSFIACWEHDGDTYNEAGHYHFQGYVQGGYKSRIRANFSLKAVTWPLGTLTFQRRSIYNNLYGHFDGGISRFHGGYDPGYTSCEPACVTG